MARLIHILILLLVIASCATQKKAGVELPLELKNRLFSTQASFELLNSFNDPLFAPLKKNKCINNWEEYVSALNKKLRGTQKNSERVLIWYELGNCYNYVGEYKKAIYFYDLVLSVEKQNDPMLSVITANIGLIYELKGLNILAKSYYEKSISHNGNNFLAKYLIALDHLRQGEFSLANPILEELTQKLPKSRAVFSTLGVSFSLSGSSSELKSKVFKFFNEKEEERVLFEIALKLFDGKQTKDDLEDLKDLELKFPVLNDYRNFLLNKFGS